MEHKGLFKAIRVHSVAESLAKRCQSMKAERQEKRREFFWGGVVASEDSPCAKAKEIEKKKNSRIEMLKKWKIDKMKRLEEAKKKQKPVFKVGIVQRKITGSPVFTQQKASLRNKLANKQCHVKSQITGSNDVEAGVVTRAKARKMALKPTQIKETNSTLKTNTNLKNKFCKIDKNKRQKVNAQIFKVPEVVCKLPYSSLTLACSPKFTRKSKRLAVTNAKAAAELEQQSREDIPNENFTPQKFQAKSPLCEKSEKSHIQQSENKSHVKTPICEEPEKLQVQPSEKSQKKSPVSEKPDKSNVVENEKFYLKSPVRVDKSHMEQDDFRPIHYSPFVTVRSGKKSDRKSRKMLTMNVEEQIEKEEKEFHCRIFSFRKYIDCEAKRLLEMCDKWRHIYEEFPELPADVEGDIDSAIGKTNLLISDKFNQFRGLIDKCENGDPFIKVDDLQGFQDWVSIEVDRVDEEFHKLDRRKCNNWKSELVSVGLVNKQPVIKTNAKNAAKKPVGKSNIRSHILASRKLLKEGNANGGEGSQLPITFPFEEAAKAKTPRKEQSLLKEVLHPERKTKHESSARKFSVMRESQNSGLEIMIATQKNKFPTPIKKSPNLTDLEVFFGEGRTPNRSILKKTPKASSSSKAHVTFKKENSLPGGRGLSEKYFQPVVETDENSPMRTILGDLGNLTVGGVKTRSRTRQLSGSASKSPRESNGRRSIHSRMSPERSPTGLAGL